MSNFPRICEVAERLESLEELKAAHPSVQPDAVNWSIEALIFYADQNKWNFSWISSGHWLTRYFKPVYKKYICVYAHVEENWIWRHVLNQISKGYQDGTSS